MTDDVDGEFDMVVARAGLVFDAESRRAMLKLYIDFRQLAETVRSLELRASDEPANVFNVTAVIGPASRKAFTF